MHQKEGQKLKSLGGKMPEKMPETRSSKKSETRTAPSRYQTLGQIKTVFGDSFQNFRELSDDVSFTIPTFANRNHHLVPDEGSKATLIAVAKSEERPIGVLKIGKNLIPVDVVRYDEALGENGKKAIHGFGRHLLHYCNGILRTENDNT